MEDETVTHAEYQRLCDQLARDAVRYAAAQAGDEAVTSDDVPCPKCKRPAGTGCKFTVSGQDAPEDFVHNERAQAVRTIASSAAPTRLAAWDRIRPRSATAEMELD